jgi:hypothetical protein
VRWPPACEGVIPGAEERLLMSQLSVALVRSDKLVAEAGDSSETQRKGKRPMLEAAAKKRPVKTEKTLCVL